MLVGKVLIEIRKPGAGWAFGFFVFWALRKELQPQSKIKEGASGKTSR